MKWMGFACVALAPVLAAGCDGCGRALPLGPPTGDLAPADDLTRPPAPDDLARAELAPFDLALAADLALAPDLANPCGGGSCSPSGAACTTSCECCSLWCATSGFCHPSCPPDGPCCGLIGDYCLTSADCCSLRCTFDNDAGIGTCRLP